MPFNPSPQSTNPFPIPSITPQPLLPPLTSLSFLRFFSFMCLAVLREIWIFFSLFFCFCCLHLHLCRRSESSGINKKPGLCLWPDAAGEAGGNSLSLRGPQRPSRNGKKWAGHRKWKEARKKRGGGGGIQSWGLQGRGDAGTTRRRRGDGGGFGLGGGSGMIGWGGEVGIEGVQTRFRDGSSQPRLVSEERCASHQS